MVVGLTFRGYQSPICTYKYFCISTIYFSFEIHILRPKLYSSLISTELNEVLLNLIECKLGVTLENARFGIKVV